jgi:ABC-type transport system substrate-binding protein
MRGDGLREAVSIPDIFNGTLFSINYAYLNNPQSEAIAQIAAEGLAQCGIQVNLTPKPAEELWAYGPDALVFGRQFDLAQFPWQAAEEPSCYLYLSEAIPGKDLEVFPQKWGGWNMTGWANEAFDTACIGTFGGAPGLDDYIQNHYTAQKIFAEQLPVIPLFTYQNIILARPDICGLEFDPTAEFSWNLENLGYGELCK